MNLGLRGDVKVRDVNWGVNNMGLHWIQWPRKCMKTEERYKIESWSTPNFRS